MDKKIKLLLNEFEFLKTQEKDTKDLLEESQTEFTKDVHQYMEENGIERKESKKNTPIEKKETELKSNAPDKYKKLFRKIVSNTHPDKLDKDIDDKNKETYKEVYEETVEGYQSENYAPLLLNAMKLGIDLGDEFNDEIKMIKDIIKEKKESIEKMKLTYAWIYYNDTEEEEKTQYIKDYYEKYKKII
tara:strand:- start:396 stop:959 length:564 start_codon:yes stop_codon:yes gene_type:complete